MGNFFKRMVRNMMTPLSLYNEDDCYRLDNFDTDIPNNTDDSISIFTPNGRKRALCIGIDYVESNRYRLNGCVNDANAITLLLKEKLYFTEENIVLMQDNAKDVNLVPTSKNILYQFDDLVSWANNVIETGEECELWLSYSGHGTYLPDGNFDEFDGKDECLVPIDSENDYTKLIKDDILKERFIDRLHPHVKVFIIVDACHSGTMFDIDESHKNIYMLSGCQDNQQSQEALIMGNTRGFLTYTFEKVYDNSLNLEEIHKKINYYFQTNNLKQNSVLSTTNDYNVYLC